MIVLIPIRSIELLNQRVEQGILSQTIAAEIKLFVNIPLSNNRRKSEHEARDLIKSYAQKSIEKYLITNDNDAMHLYADNFQCLVDFIDKNPDVGAVALWSGSSNSVNHIKPECCLWRREVLANICQLNIEGADHKTCCCERYRKSVEKQGFIIVYLDLLKRIKTI